MLLAIERHEHGREFGRGVGVSNAATDRAPRADSGMPNQPDSLGQQPVFLLYERRIFQRALFH